MADGQSRFRIQPTSFCSLRNKKPIDEAIPKGKKFILEELIWGLDRYSGRIKGGFRKGKGKVKNGLIEQQKANEREGEGGGG